jgi:DNA invertase Pin-like site-specific DNA recombinase
MGLDRVHHLGRRLNCLIRLLIPVFYRPHKVHMALRETAARLRQITAKVRELNAAGLGPTEIANALKIGRASVYRALGSLPA